MTKNNLKVVKSTKDQELDNKEKNKALEAAISQITDNFGKGSVMKLGEKRAMDIESISARSSHMRAQCSPKALEPSKRPTTFSWASSVMSAAKASASSMEGGRPVRSKLTRRIQLCRSESADGLIPSASS